MSAHHIIEYRRMSSDELDAALFGLAVECPFGDCRQDCPLDPLREKSLRERFVEITALSHTGKLRMMDQLIDCFTDLQARTTVTENT